MRKRTVILLLVACSLLAVHVAVNLLGPLLLTRQPRSQSVPSAIRQIGGRFETDDIGNIISVTLTDVNSHTDLSFMPLIRQRLKELTLREVHVNDEHVMQRIGQLPALRSLRIIEGSFKVTIENRHFPSLSTLIISKCDISDSVLANLGATRLQCLKVSNAPISDFALQAVGKTATLEELLLSNNPNVSDHGIAHLAELRNLRKLYLFRLTLTGRGFSKFYGYYPLEHLDLSNTSLSSKGFQNVGVFSHLTFLNVSGTSLDDEGMGAISSLTELTVLGIADTNVSDEGVRRVRSLVDLRELNLAGTKVTDSGLMKLEGLPLLSTIEVSLGDGITMDGVERLRSEMPQVSVYIYSEVEESGGMGGDNGDNGGDNGDN